MSIRNCQRGAVVEILIRFDSGFDDVRRLHASLSCRYVDQDSFVDTTISTILPVGSKVIKTNYVYYYGLLLALLLLYI